jgi:hypothetical protein
MKEEEDEKISHSVQTWARNMGHPGGTVEIYIETLELNLLSNI